LIKKVFDHFEEGVCVILMASMLLITFVNVISRYVFHASMSYTDEVTTGMFVYLTTFGTAIAAKRKAHLGLSLITDRMKGRLKAVVISFTFILCAVFSCILLYTGWQMMMNQVNLGQISAALEIPEWLYGAAIPIGGFFMLFRFAQAAWLEIKSVKEEA